jgi:hypothetical protein
MNMQAAKIVFIVPKPSTCVRTHLRSVLPNDSSVILLTHRWRTQKEPKLSRARQIPEWEEYDNEIAQFARGLAAEGKIRSSIATAGSDVLANVGLAPDSGDKDHQHSHDEL